MTFTWQAGRQLATLQKGTTGVSYTYGSDGTRLTKTVNGVKTSYTWDGAQLVSQKTGNEAIYFLYHGSSRVGLEYKGNTYYYIYNLQGDVVGLVNSSGTSVVSYTYDAWGNPESISGSMASTLGAANPFRYRSYYFDTESGLYYLMSRYYDPVVGRFLNADSYVSTGQGLLGHNMFAYCQNNPIIYKDTTGNFVISALIASALIGGIVGGCIGMGFGAMNAKAAGTDVGVGMTAGFWTGFACGGLGAVGAGIGTGAAILTTSLIGGVASTGIDAWSQKKNYDIGVKNGTVEGEFELDVPSMIIAGVGGTLSTAAGGGLGKAISLTNPAEMVIGGIITGGEVGLTVGCFDSAARALEIQRSQKQALLRSKFNYSGVNGVSNYVVNALGGNKRSRLEMLGF